MIRVQNISKIYENGNVLAVDNISFEIKDGEFVALTGISGSGKSTVLSLIGGIEKPSKNKDGSIGHIYYDDKDILSYNDYELSKFRLSNIGFVFQFFNINNEMTVFENVEIPLAIAGKRINRKEKIISVLKELGVDDKINTKCKFLSGGQKQRVAIARALINDAKVILADEPTGNLDYKNGREVISLLRDIARNGRIVILVTHNVDDADKTDRIIELQDGKILRDEDLR